jgi:hypothetical protein
VSPLATYNISIRSTEFTSYLQATVIAPKKKPEFSYLQFVLIGISLAIISTLAFGDESDSASEARGDVFHSEGNWFEKLAVQLCLESNSEPIGEESLNFEIEPIDCSPIVSVVILCDSRNS